MNQKQFNKLVKEAQEHTKQELLTKFLKHCFPEMSIKQGCAIWWLLQNRSLIVEGKDISGSFRYNASCISHVVGKKTNYLNFYCSFVRIGKGKYYFTEEYALKQLKHIKKFGGKIKNTIHELPLETYKKEWTSRDCWVMLYWLIVRKVYTCYKKIKLYNLMKK